jgi:lysine-specific demethylase 8
VQIVGEKYVRLYSPDVSKELHPGKGHLMNTSTVNLECPGLPQGKGPHADAASLPFTEVVLRAGQSLYIPAGHWHYVRSISPSFSVNVWWD